MDKRVEHLIKVWQKRNIRGFYCENKKATQEKILELIPPKAGIGFSGSLTLDQLNIAKLLEERGNKVISHAKAGLSREESLIIRRQATQADYYLASANAISETGELVFFSAYGNRITGISYADKVILICGINKITANLAQALKRAREYVTPLNCKRLNWNTPCFSRSTIFSSGGIPIVSGKGGICRKEICLFPEYKRMCCQILIIEAEISPDRLKVIIVAEPLGF